jgi:DhnA family fructose-bisphosphate aldolase class Ia
MIQLEEYRMTSGTALRVSNLFTEGRSVIVAIDHGLFDGPIESMEDLDEISGKISDEVDGILLSPGSLRRLGAGLFGRRGSPRAIVRINWSTIYCFQWGYTSGDTVPLVRAEDIVRMGAEAVLISLSLQTGDQERDAANVKVFADLCRDAHNLGLAVIGEYFPVDVPSLSPEQLHSEILVGTRVLAELGADLIKTYHTCNFGEVTRGCPIPILTLGGNKTPRPIDALRAAESQIADGASGVVFGRNAIQTPGPIAFQKALIDIVRHGHDAESAMAKYGVE